jgi:hypothetical protein
MMTEFDEQATSRDVSLRLWLTAFVKYLVGEDTLAIADGYEMATLRWFPGTQEEVGRLRDQAKHFVKYAHMWNLKTPVDVRGVFGWSELCMHVNITDVPAIYALANETKTYALILAADGRMVDGSFHLFDDNTFSVS